MPLIYGTPNKSETLYVICHRNTNGMRDTVIGGSSGSALTLVDFDFGIHRLATCMKHLAIRIL